MVNATQWEIAWSGIFALGTILGLILLGFLIARLIRRYQRKRNGGGRLLAWKDTLLVVLLIASFLAALTVGVVSLLSPGAGKPDLGPVEAWALIWLASYAVPVLVLMGGFLVSAIVLIGVFEVLIDRYLRGTADLEDDGPPDKAAAAEAAQELAAAALLAAEQVALAASTAAAEIADAAVRAAQVAASAREAAQIIADAKAATAPVSGVVAAATINTAALMENTAALHENTDAAATRVIEERGDAPGD